MYLENFTTITKPKIKAKKNVKKRVQLIQSMKPIHLITRKAFEKRDAAFETVHQKVDVAYNAAAIGSEIVAAVIEKH